MSATKKKRDEMERLVRNCEVRTLSNNLLAGIENLMVISVSINEREKFWKFKENPNLLGYYNSDSDAYFYITDRDEMKAEEYHTQFHEMIHATGHPKRLNRISSAEYNRPEMKKIEEAIATWGAYELCRLSGIRMPKTSHQGSYGSWLKWIFKYDFTKEEIREIKKQVLEAVRYITKQEVEVGNYRNEITDIRSY
jgi:hypothetical protein